MFDNKYAYTDFHELNLDWVLSKLTEFEKRIDNISSDIVKEANAYTDSQLASIRSDFNAFKNEVNEQISGLDEQYEAFTREINNRLVITDAKIRKLTDQVNSVLAIANEYTNQAILNNNEYIISETTKNFSTVKVVNYFTGLRVSVQEMFDYLAQFHLENAINYLQLANREKTYNQLIAYNMTYTDLAKNGGTIIQ